MNSCGSSLGGGHCDDGSGNSGGHRCDAVARTG
jgi:hypothetical protein